MEELVLIVALGVLSLALGMLVNYSMLRRLEVRHIRRELLSDYRRTYLRLFYELTRLRDCVGNAYTHASDLSLGRYPLLMSILKGKDELVLMKPSLRENIRAFIADEYIPYLTRYHELRSQLSGLAEEVNHVSSDDIEQILNHFTPNGGSWHSSVRPGLNILWDKEEHLQQQLNDLIKTIELEANM